MLSPFLNLKICLLLRFGTSFIKFTLNLNIRKGFINFVSHPRSKVPPEKLIAFLKEIEPN